MFIYLCLYFYYLFLLFSVFSFWYLVFCMDCVCFVLGCGVCRRIRHENRKKTTTRTDTREKYVDNETADTAHKTGHNRNNGAPRARFNVRSEETEKFLDPRRSFIYWTVDREHKSFGELKWTCWLLSINVANVLWNAKNVVCNQ